MPKSFSARIFVALIVISGLMVLGDVVLHAKAMPTVRILAFLLAACLAARLKIKLPGLTGTMSVNLPFILVAVAEMNTAEALAVGFISTFVQCLPRGKQKLNLVQAAFNCSTITLAVAATRLIYTSPSVNTMVTSPSLRLAIAAAGYALANSVPVAIVIRLTEGVNALRTWVEMLQLSFPYLLASACVAGLSLIVTGEVAWQVPLAMLPLMAGIYLSYRRYFAATAAPVTSNVQVQAGRRAAAGAHV
jgi:hypothetical protein